MQFIITDKIESDKLYTLLDENKYLLNNYYKNVVNKERFIQNEMGNYKNNPDLIIKYFISNNKLKGFYCLEKLDWDSSIFKRNMWKMKVIINDSLLDNVNEIKSSFIEDCSSNNIDHISCQVKSNDYFTTELLGKLEFKIVDSIIRFGTKLDSKKTKDIISNKDTVNIRQYKIEDYEKVMAVAKKVFENYPNRFFNDGEFNSEECKRMYIEWTKNSLKGFANIVIVSELSEKIIGFSTIKYKKPFSDEKIISEGQLSGVLSSYRGKGINTKMLKKRLDIASQKADYYEVGTQIYNYASQRTFYKCGLKPIDTYFSFHISL